MVRMLRANDCKELIRGELFIRCDKFSVRKMKEMRKTNLMYGSYGVRFFMSVIYIFFVIWMNENIPVGGAGGGYMEKSYLSSIYLVFRAYFFVK